MLIVNDTHTLSSWHQCTSVDLLHFYPHLTEFLWDMQFHLLLHGLHLHNITIVYTSYLLLMSRLGFTLVCFFFKFYPFSESRRGQRPIAFYWMMMGSRNQTLETLQLGMLLFFYPVS